MTRLTPKVGPVVGSTPGWVVERYGSSGRPPSGVATTDGRRAHGVELDGSTPICDCITAHVVGGPTHRVWPGATCIPFVGGWGGCTSAPRPSGVHTDGSDGTLPAPRWAGRVRSGYCATWRGLSRLYQVSSPAVRLAVCTCLTGLTMQPVNATILM